MQKTKRYRRKTWTSTDASDFAERLSRLERNADRAQLVEPRGGSPGIEFVRVKFVEP